MYHIITDFPAETSGVKNPLAAEYSLPPEYLGTVRLQRG